MLTAQELKMLLVFMDRLEYKGLNETHFASQISSKLIAKLQKMEKQPSPSEANKLK